MIRNIVTTYHDLFHNEIRTNRSVHPRKAVMAALDHLSQEHYALKGTNFTAKTAVIHDEVTGELHSILSVDRHGDVKTMFKRDPKEPTCITV